MEWMMWSMRDDAMVSRYYFESAEDIKDYLEDEMNFQIHKINRKIKVVFVS